MNTEQGIMIADIPDFNPVHIFECGQAFRWDWDGTGYTGIAGDKVIRLAYENGHLLLENTEVEDYRHFWSRYFDMEKDYGKKKAVLSKDPVLARAVGYGWGIRILNQEPWEILISFIISANNGILRIKRIINNLAGRYGKRVLWKGREYYTFPAPCALAGAYEEDLFSCGCGYRAPYIKKTAQMVADGVIELDRLNGIPYENAYRILLECAGVGPKVADCILLFALEKGEAFPVDVWIKRIMEHFYFKNQVPVKRVKEFAQLKFGGLAGLAQQYLFYYAREHRIGR